MLRRRSRSGARIISLMSAIAMLGGQVYFPFEAKAEESESWKATDLIKNGDFETGDLSGWTVDMPDSDGDAVGYKIKVDEWASNNKTNILNYWNNNESASFEFSQDIKDVKAGTYKLSWGVPVRILLYLTDKAILFHVFRKAEIQQTINFR